LKEDEIEKKNQFHKLFQIKKYQSKEWRPSLIDKKVKYDEIDKTFNFMNYFK
jgi:hypothetical protein